MQKLQAKGPGHGETQTLVDVSPIQAITLRNVLKSWHWAGYKQILDLSALLCGHDYQWQVVRKQIMDLANEQERMLVVMVNRILKEEGNGEEIGRVD